MDYNGLKITEDTRRPITEKGQKLYNIFKSEFLDNGDMYNGCIPYNSCLVDGFEMSVFEELVAAGLIQRRECEGFAYELTSDIREKLFSDKLMSVDKLVGEAKNKANEFNGEVISSVVVDFNFSKDLKKIVDEFKNELGLDTEEVSVILADTKVQAHLCEAVEDYLAEECISFEDLEFTHHNIDNQTYRCLAVIKNAIDEYKQYVVSLHHGALLDDLELQQEKVLKKPLRDFTVDKVLADAQERCDAIGNNEYFKENDEWFTYYVNVKTGEKKLELDKGDVEVEAPKRDDFYHDEIKE